jgi:hypothetical protein
MDIREKLRNPGYQAKVTPAELAQDLALLKALPLDELLDFLVDLSGDLSNLVNGLPDLILEGLERQLPNDTASQLEATALLKRMSSKPSTE